MAQFKDVKVGQTFDFVGPEPMYNSFYDTCVKTGQRSYRSLLRTEHADYRIGSINCEVYHVAEIAADDYGKPGIFVDKSAR